MTVSSSTIRILCMLSRRGRKSRLGNDRQFHDEARSDRLVFLHANRSMMLFDDAAHDRQAQSGSALSGGEIRQEELFLQLAGHAMAGICDGDFDPVTAGYQQG